MINEVSQKYGGGEIAVTGIGMITALGAEVSTVWSKLTGAAFPSHSAGPLEIPPPASGLRRINRYSKIAVAAALNARDDASITVFPGSEFRYGTVFTTGYGSIESNVRFCESTAENDPDICSPTLFAGTVANSCVGQVCIQLKLKGSSTLLIGGNVFLYSGLLLKSNKVDIIFAGAVEEYCTDLFESMRSNETANGINIQESAIVLVLTRNDPRRENTYCVIGKSESVSLDVYPLIKKAGADCSRSAVSQAISRCVKDGGDVGAVISAANGGYFDIIESEAIAEVLPGVPVVQGVKRVFGETMGSSFSLNVAIGAMCVKNNVIPALLTSGRDMMLSGTKRILVTGYDTIGNYHCVILHK